MKNSCIIIAILLSQKGFAQTIKNFEWIGGPTYVLQLGSFKILTDPMLSAKNDSAFIIKKHPSTGESNAIIKRYFEPVFFNTSNIDLLLISHTHPDHFDEKAKETLSKEIKIISPITSKPILLQWGFNNIKELQWNDTLMIKKGNEYLRIIAVKALHAEDEPLNTELGKVNGYFIEYWDEKTMYRIYWTGDTVWFDEINDYKKYSKINLFIPNMGAVGSNGSLGRRGLNADDCIKIIEVLNPKLIIPVHHSTFSHYVEPIAVLKTKFPQRRNHKLIIPPVGKTINLK